MTLASIHVHNVYAAISAVLPLEQRYPHIRLNPVLPTDSAEYRAMQSYIQQCFSCHQMNHRGDAIIGPTLNLPLNPTEYFQANYLRLYIRDPASVRACPQIRMPAFSRSAFNDTQLNDLLAYLHHMRSRKLPTPSCRRTSSHKAIPKRTSKKNQQPRSKNLQRNVRNSL